MTIVLLSRSTEEKPVENVGLEDGSKDWSKYIACMSPGFIPWHDMAPWAQLHMTVFFQKIVKNWNIHVAMDMSLDTIIKLIGIQTDA